MSHLSITMFAGHVLLVDEADGPFVLSHTWSARRTAAGGAWYAGRQTVNPGGSRTTVYLHRALLTPPRGLHVDHINGNGLDNRRANLRVCTHRQNGLNRGAGKRSLSGFRGVEAHHSRWRARLFVHGAPIIAGVFETPEEAARAYDAAAVIHHGEFAHLNFPEAK